MDDIHLSHYDPEIPLYALTRHVTSPFRVSITSRIMLLPCITYSCRSETWVGCPLGITSMQDIETYVSVKIVGLVAFWAFGACLIRHPLGVSRRFHPGALWHAKVSFTNFTISHTPGISEITFMLECFLRQRFQLQLDAVVKTQARQLFSWPPAITACSHDSHGCSPGHSRGYCSIFLTAITTRMAISAPMTILVLPPWQQQLVLA